MADESPFRERGPIGDDDACRILGTGEIEVLGQMPWSSNATLLVDIHHDDAILQGVYKPGRGERPLWDFPGGLYKREVASYRLSAALGWDLVPPTIERDGPHGPGSLQLFVPCDFSQHYFHLVSDAEHHHPLQRLCAFDVVANSTDRKGGHCLVDRDGHIWAIDNGLTFHSEFKLRTVIWDWEGEPIPGDIREDLVCLLDQGIPASVAELIHPDECIAVLDRTKALLDHGHFPVDTTGRHHPWPLV